MRSLILAVLLLDPSAHARAASAAVRVDLDQPGHTVSPLLYGIFFEEINRAGDGGLYAEMLQNRSFEDNDKSPQAWTGDASVAMTLNRNKALAKMNPSSLQLEFKRAGGSVMNAGFSREAGKDRAAYPGGLVFRQGEALQFSLYQRGKAALEVRLEGRDGQTLAQASLPQPGADWQKVELSLTPAATDLAGKLVLAGKAEGKVWIDELSLVPAKTWKGHGLRSDLAEAVAAMQPAFVRFPGGCFVEGYSPATASRWKDSIGDMAGRRGVNNLWGYRTSGGFGAYEFFQWCEDLGAEPLYVINCGMGHGYEIPMSKMGELVQDALDLVEYARGPADSPWGKVRAAAGHPAPFKLNYIEIGNENGGPKYAERYALMYDALKARYPDIHLIANDWFGVPKDHPVDYRDEHFYTDAAVMKANANRYDSYDRKGSKVYVGEYAVTQGCGLGNLSAAVAEAACMTGLEANSDIVKMSSYAPLLVHPAWKAWNPNAIVFDESRFYGTPSYHVQAMFAANRGDVVVPVDVEQPKIAYSPPKGLFGLGTWGTQAEYKDFKFTAPDGTVIFASDPSKGMDAWKVVRGQWRVKDGALQQSSGEDDAVAVVADSHWGDGVLTLRARKLSGREGFLVIYQAADEKQHRWWNLGGWGNTLHGLEQSGGGDARIEGSIETARWYDIRIELSGPWVRCYLDGKLTQEVERAVPKALYVVAGKSQNGKELIMKVVNAEKEPLNTTFTLRGTQKVGKQSEAVVLTSKDANDENSFDAPQRVAPVRSKVAGLGKTFTRQLPPMSVTILRIPLVANSKGTGL